MLRLVTAVPRHVEDQEQDTTGVVAKLHPYNHFIEVLRRYQKRFALVGEPFDDQHPTTRHATTDPIPQTVSDSAQASLHLAVARRGIYHLAFSDADSAGHWTCTFSRKDSSSQNGRALLHMKSPSPQKKSAWFIMVTELARQDPFMQALCTRDDSWSDLLSPGSPLRAIPSSERASHDSPSVVRFLDSLVERLAKLP